MSCEFEEDLTAYVDRELPPLRARQLEGHLPGCSGCTATLALLQRTASALASMPAFAPSAQLRRDVLTRISEEVPLSDRLKELLLGWLRPQVMLPALSAAAVVALAIIATQVTRGPRGSGPGDAPLMVADASELELAQNLDLVEDLDVVGLESPEDLEVVERLQELEGQP
ncbi:MAG TPA: zf-HC2 domain-containing protein [Myxococcales bacterium]|nr:zf-HC2 domain-containing protein [Myxococcales bacterium]